MGTKILRGAHKSYLLVSKIPLLQGEILRHQKWGSNPQPSCNEFDAFLFFTFPKVRYILMVTLPSLNGITHVHKYKKLPITKAYFQGQFCNICKCPDAHFYYIKIRIAKRKKNKRSFFWLSDLSSKIVFKFAVSFRYWSLQTTHSYFRK